MTGSGADLSDLAYADDESIDLAVAALRIALIEYKRLDFSRWLAELDQLAVRARDLAPGTSDWALLYGLDAALFVEAGFHGNVNAYYDPRNSFLNDVLERRQGIPITLSVVYVEVARRLGLPVAGVSFPGHFLVAYFGDSRVEFIDAFNRGARLDERACRDLLARSAGPDVAFSPEFVKPASRRQTLVRILNNLKAIYARKDDLVRAVAVMDRLLQIAPDAVGEYRDRGLALFQLGDAKRALHDLEAYVERSGRPEKGGDLELAIAAARRSVAQLN
jgi:regulator of sirC expression with transglutaminase-like and TPR domain